jgi:hypothetical protein
MLPNASRVSQRRRVRDARRLIIERRPRRPLVEKLQEGVLRVVAGLAPDDGGSLAFNRLSIMHDGLGAASVGSRTKLMFQMPAQTR